MARTREDEEDDLPGWLTTFQVAKLVGVSPPTVVNWVNAGLLSASRTPGGHRRIRREELSRFAKDQGYTLPPSFSEPEAEREVVEPPRVPHVLVVDDEEDFCLLMQTWLQGRAGWAVSVAYSGFAAGLAVARNTPDLILMDIQMPDMDGFTVLQTLRQDPHTRHIPVLACTALRDVHAEARALSDGFDGWLEKPLRLEALIEQLTPFLSLSAARGQASPDGHKSAY